jgi:hypothetical protein
VPRLSPRGLARSAALAAWLAGLPASGQPVPALTEAEAGVARRLDRLQRYAEFRCGGMRPLPEDLVSTRVIGEQPEPLPAELARRRAREACWAATVGPYAVDARGVPSWPAGAEPPPPPDPATWRRAVE